MHGREVEREIWMEQGKLDFGGYGGEGYFEFKEGIIFSMIREECPGGRISFSVAGEGNRRQFRVECRTGNTYLMKFTEAFLYSRNIAELKEDLVYNLDYMKRSESSTAALFDRNCVTLRDLPS